MGQLRKMLTVLLPVFWLVTFVACPFASTLACAGPIECASASCPAGNATQAGDQCGAADDMVRWDGRRQGMARIQAEQPRRELFSSPPATPTRITPAISPTNAAFLLQQRWQFVWRTADSPRAPSFLA